MPLDALVQEIVNHSADSKFEELLSILNSPATNNVLKSHAGSLLEAYGTLNPAMHSLGCLVLL